MKETDRVEVIVEPFVGETGVIHKVLESQPVGFPEGWSLAVVMDSKEKWNHRSPMLFHQDELRMSYSK
jgi:hypothetical protein